MVCVKGDLIRGRMAGTVEISNDRRVLGFIHIKAEIVLHMPVPDVTASFTMVTEDTTF